MLEGPWRPSEVLISLWYKLWLTLNAHKPHRTQSQDVHILTCLVRKISIHKILGSSFVGCRLQALRHEFYELFQGRPVFLA